MALVLGLVLATQSAGASVLGRQSTLQLPSLLGWLGGKASPVWPRSKTGSAAGKGHYVSAASTRAGKGRGKAPGHGKGALAAYKPAAEKVRAGKSGTVPRGFDVKTSRRVTRKSSANVTWFANKDGSYTRTISATPVNYRDSQGAWQPIDTTLVRSSGAWKQKANGFGVSFAAGSSGGAKRPELAKIELSPSRSFGWSLAGAAPVTPVVSGNTAEYKDVLPSTTLQLTSQAAGVKETLILKSASAGNTFTFPLSLTGVTLRQGSGVWELVDSAGKTVAALAAPWAEDSSRHAKTGAPAITRDVAYALKTVNGVQQLTMTVSSSWLNDKARVWPVRVDPTLTVSTAGATATNYVESTLTANNSSSQSLPIGYDGVGTNRSYLYFPSANLVSTGYHVTAAQFAGYAFWQNNTASTYAKYNVGPITSDWAVDSSLSWSTAPNVGTAMGTWAGSSTAATCTVDGTSYSGAWTHTNLDTAQFNSWATGASKYYGLALTANSETDGNYWKKFASSQVTGCAPYLSLTYAANVAPQVTAGAPSSGSALHTLTPTLSATGADSDSWPDSSLKYEFKVYSGTKGTLLASSSLQAGGTWTVPSGKLRWGHAYTWRVRSHDGWSYSDYADQGFTVTSPPPLLTSGLSQDTGKHGFSASIGNYTTSATDAKVITVGPELQIERHYNSLDTRGHGAFGAAWSSLLDSRATQVLDASGAVLQAVVTYPDGSNRAFGRNADGTYAPPQGMYATLTFDSGSGYTLVDDKGVTYAYARNPATGVYLLKSITDASGRAVTLTYDSTGNLVTQATSASGRSLYFTWDKPTGATRSHIIKVVTDPVTAGNAGTALTWTYAYAGDKLTGVCTPTNDCTTYAYAAGSQYATTVLDNAPDSYWRLGESSGMTAASGVLVNEQADAGTYSATPSTTATGLAGGSGTAAVFNGTSSRVSLPSGLIGAGHQTWSVALRFKTTGTSQVLFSHSASPISAGTASSYQSNLYVGSDGKLVGGVGIYGLITSASAVNDGAWHHAVLTVTAGSDTLYLDGAKVGSGNPGPDTAPEPYTYIGAGFLGEGWYNQSNYLRPAKPFYFQGAISDVAFYNRQLTATDAASQYAAGTTPVPLLTSITKPSGSTAATASYDTVSGRVTGVTDDNGGSWGVAAPSVSGSSQVYRSAVLGSGAGRYWRLGDAAGATAATNELNSGSGTYNNVTLGSASVFSDATATVFNGSSSAVTLPSNTLNEYKGTAWWSVSLWFKTTATSGVLFSHSAAALSAGSATGSYQPNLYIGSDGKLLGGSGASGVITTSSAVNDGAWHHVVLTVGGTGSLYLDGKLVGTATSSVDSASEPNTYVGAGFLGGDWPDQPNNGASAATPVYFDGSIAEAAVWRWPLADELVSSLYKAAKNSTGIVPVQTVAVTDPGGKTLTYRHDPQNSHRTLSFTDGLGGTTTYGYDTAGFLHTTVDPNGNKTITAHDEAGTVTAQTACQDASVDACSTSYTNPETLTAGAGTYELPAATSDGRSSSATDTTYQTTYTYDSSGNRTSVTTPPVSGTSETTTTTYTDGTSILAHGSTSVYAPKGLPVKVTAPDDGVGTTTYYATGDVATETDPLGKVTTYTYDNLGRKLTETVAWGTTSAVTSYTYDADGRVLTETSPATTDVITGYTHQKVTTNTYNADGQVTKVVLSDAGTGQDASRTTTTGYTSHGQVASVTDPVGHTTSTIYDAYGNQATTTDGLGNVTAHTHDANGHLLTTVLRNYTGDPVSPSSATDLVTESRAYDPAGRLASITDALGNVTKYTYYDDGKADRTVKTNPTGSSSFILEDNTYDAAGNLIRQYTNDWITETVYSYDADGRMVTKTEDPSGVHRTTTYTYADSRADQTSGQACDDAADTQASDAVQETAQPCATTGDTQTTNPTDADSTPTGASSDADSAAPSAVPAGDGSADDQVATETVTVGSTSVVTTSTWDKGGNQLMKAVSGDGTTRTTTWTRDARGLPTSMTDSLGNATTYTYDPAGQLTQTTGPAVTSEVYSTSTLATTAVNSTPITSTGWNTFGEEAETEDATGVITTNTLDANGRVVAITGAPYTPHGASVAITPVQTRTYDANGQLLTSTTPKGAVTHHTYDQFGNVAKTVDARGGVTHKTFDANGQELTSTSPAGVRTAKTWDWLGQQTTSSVWEVARNEIETTTYYYFDGLNWIRATKSPAGVETVNSYNALGDKTSVTDGASNITRYTYDGFGHITKTTQPDGTYATNAHDALGDVVATAAYDASGTKQSETSATFDKQGNKLTATNELGYTTTFTYSATGELTGLTQPVTPSSSISVSYGYDLNGNKTRYTDGRGNSRYWTYNTLGKIDTKVVPATSSYPSSTAPDITTYEIYDADGNPTQHIQPRGVTVTNTYDESGNLLTQSGTGAETATAARVFTYDGDGHQVTAKTCTDTGCGTVHTSGTFAYTSKGKLATATGTAGSTTATYTADGLPATRTDAAGTTTYTYDAAGRLASLADPATGKTFTYTYNPVSKPATITYGTGGNVRRYTYDAQHRITKDALATNTGTSVASISYGYDTAGQLTSKTDLAGIPNAYTYDRAGRLTSWSDGTNTTTYGYDPASNRTSMVKTTIANGAVTSNVTNTYDARDELTARSDTAAGGAITFTYTARGTLKTAGNVAHTFDAYGQNISQGNITYTYDALGRITNNGSQAIEYVGASTRQTSDGTSTYTYSPDGALAAAKAGGNAGDVIWTDRHTDVAATFTPTATSLTGIHTYDPLGTTLTNSGDTITLALGYQASYTDQTTGNIDMDARWYSPSAGQFTSADPTDPTDPANANLYVYASATPLDKVDPTGTTSVQVQSKPKEKACYNSNRHTGYSEGHGAVLLTVNWCATWTKKRRWIIKKSVHVQYGYKHRTGYFKQWMSKEWFMNNNDYNLYVYERALFCADSAGITCYSTDTVGMKWWGDPYGNRKASRW